MVTKYTCSVCGTTFSYWNTYGEMRFCPKCKVAEVLQKFFGQHATEAAKLKKLEQDQMTRRLGRELADEVLRKMGIVARG